MEVAVPHVHSASSTVAAAHHQPHDMGKCVYNFDPFFCMQGGDWQEKTGVN